MEMKIKNRLVEIRRFENVMTIVLQIVRPVDGLTCCVSTLNFAAVHRSVLVTKRYLLSMQIAGGEVKHDNREDGDDEDDGYERRSSPEASQPSSRCFVTLCCEPANS